MTKKIKQQEFQAEVQKAMNEFAASINKLETKYGVSIRLTLHRGHCTGGNVNDGVFQHDHKVDMDLMSFTDEEVIFV